MGVEEWGSIVAQQATGECRESGNLFLGRFLSPRNACLEDELAVVGGGECGRVSSGVVEPSTAKLGVDRLLLLLPKHLRIMLPQLLVRSMLDNAHTSLTSLHTLGFPH